MGEAKRYWIALNGATCARSGWPMRHPQTTPRAWQLIGFPTDEEAIEAQRVCLEESIPAVAAFMESLRPAVDAGTVKVIQHDDPEPPCPGEPTMWTDAPLPKNAN